MLVGVGDGPWDDMRKFDDKIPARDFDNFQVPEFTTLCLMALNKILYSANEIPIDIRHLKGYSPTY